MNQIDPDGKTCLATAKLVFGPRTAWTVGSDGQAVGPNIDMQLNMRCTNALRRDAYFTLRYNFCRKDGEGRPINSSCAPGGDVVQNGHRYAPASSYRCGGSGRFKCRVNFLYKVDGAYLANNIGVYQSCQQLYQQRFGMIAQWYTDDPDPGDPADGPYIRFTPKFKKDVPNAWGKVYPGP